MSRNFFNSIAKSAGITQKEFAELYGIMLGDGCLSAYGKGKRAVVVTGNLHDDRPFFDKVVVPRMSKLRRKHINCRLKPKQGSVEVNFVNGYVFDIFKGLGFPVGLKGEINIPHFLMRTPLERRVISGIFATDGSLVITNNNGTMYPRVEFRSSSVTLLRQIRRVLKRCGMKGGLYPKYTRLQYNGNSNLELFVSKVGFLNPKQNDKYKQWMQSSSVGVAHGRMMRHAAGKAW